MTQQLVNQHPSQIVLTSTQRSRLDSEGLVTIDDFKDFKDYQLEQAMKILKISISSAPPQLKSV